MKKKPSYIDIKQTFWIRVQLEEGTTLNDVKNVVNGCVSDDSVIFDTLKITNKEEVDGTSEFLPATENDGQSTIEVYAEDGELLFDNSIK
jgi:hypothetical protein